MSTDLFITQLIAQQISSAKNLTGVADGVSSKSLRHPQSRDALENNDQGFLKTLERFNDNRKPSRESKPSDRNKTPVAEESSPDSGYKSDMADCPHKTHNNIGAHGHTQVENNVAAGGQNINSAHLSLFDQLTQFGIELLTDENHRPIQLIGSLCGNEKTILKDLSRKISSQLSQPGTPSQNAISAAGKINISGDTTDGDNKLLARLETDWALKAMIGGKSTKIKDLTEVIRLNSNPNPTPAQETGQNIQRHISKNDLYSKPVAKNESTTPMLTHPSPVNNESHAQNVKIANINPSIASADKAVTKICTGEPDAKDGGFLFNQSQSEVKTPETKLVTPKTEMFQKDFHSQTVNQIVQKAVLYLNRGQHEVRLDLKPDFLGHIRMQIITEHHQVTVRILTEYPMVKELIENSLPQLKSELQNHGLEIDELDVSVTDDADQQVADRKMAEHTKTKQAAEHDDHSEDGPSKGAAASIARSIRNQGSTRIDFFA